MLLARGFALWLVGSALACLGHIFQQTQLMFK